MKILLDVANDFEITNNNLLISNNKKWGLITVDKLLENVNKKITCLEKEIETLNQSIIDLQERFTTLTQTLIDEREEA